MTDLQALAVGALLGWVMRAPDYGLRLRPEIERDEDGNYLPTFVIVGLDSGDRVRVTVEPEP